MRTRLMPHFAHQPPVSTSFPCLSMMVKISDEISVKEKSRNIPQIKNAIDAARRKGTSSWIEVDPDKFVGKVVADPKREELTLPINEQQIVELYSR